MVKNHIKSMAAPRTWPVHRKERKYQMRPSPGPHALEHSLTLKYILVNLLGLASTRKEATLLTHTNQVLVNGTRRKRVDFPVGLFDIITVADKHWRMAMDERGTLRLRDAKAGAAIPRKIIGKKQVKKKTQLNLFDGTNTLVEKDTYKVGDSVLLENGKVMKHFPLKKGASIFLIGGRSRGTLGVVEDIVGRKIIYKHGKDVHETLRRYAYPVGEDKPAIDL